MNVLSLFAGIGGLDLGLERAGMTLVGQVEIDPFCRAVLEKHWPGVARHDDVRTCVDWWLGEPRPAVDVVAGGFPCQPVSVAGRQRAQQDERWLWPAFAAVIRDLRPRYAIMENVPGLLARGMGDVLGDLAEIGYDAEWDCVPAAAVGANHRRDRVFILAHPSGEPGRVQPEPEPGRGSTTIPGVNGEARLVADANRPDRRREARSAESGTGGGALRERSTEPGRRGGDVADTECESWGSRGTGDAQQGARGRDAGGGGIGPDVAHPDGSGQSQPSGSLGQVRRWVGDGGQPLAHAHGSRREPWAWMGGSWPAPVRDGWWTTEPDVGRVAHGVSGRVDRLRGLGNAVVPQVAEHIGRLVMEAAA